jgi:5'-3' exonuclease
VFDGTAPIEKHAERLTRHQRREAVRERIRMLELDLDTFKQTNVLSDDLKRIDNKVRKLHQLHVNEHMLREHINRMKLQVSSVSADDFATVRTILDAFGIQYIFAESEAEFMCAAMARHGVVDAVMTRDTDAIACLAPTIITNVSSAYFHVVSLDKILSYLDMTPETFQDLCIMCGTDFNQNIPRIGPARSYDLLYKRIEFIPPDINTDCLKYQRTREIFSFCDTKPIVELVSGVKRPNYDMLASMSIDAKDIQNRLKPKVITTL